MTDQEIIDDYFSDPKIKELLDKELGPTGKIKVDWDNRIVTAKGPLSGRQWDLDEMLTDLKRRLQ